MLILTRAITGCGGNSGGSASWKVVGSAGFSDGTIANPSIAIDGSGVPYVVYKDYGTDMPLFSWDRVPNNKGWEKVTYFCGCSILLKNWSGLG